MKRHNLFNLHEGEADRGEVLKSVYEGTSFGGGNLVMLAFAMIIASIGLNINSYSVMIGAMLISPLMGPTVGIGFALATYNISLLKKAIKNLLLSAVVSIIVSYIYFLITPYKEAQSEILTYISPTIYDVLIAFTGGVVGAISITRAKKGNPLLGVAIATSLMPPLCTAGFGLATLNFKFAIGALYYFFINSFFIALATFMIIKYLKYPQFTTQDEKFDKKVKYSIYVLFIIMIVPSIFLAYRLVRDRKYTQNVENFIKNEFTDRGHTVIYKKINKNETPKTIELVLLNQRMDSIEIQALNKKLADSYEIKDTKLLIKNNSSNLKSEILAEINQQNKDFSEKDIIIQNLTAELNEYKFDDRQLIKELRIIFPEIENISIGKLNSYEKDSRKQENTILYQIKEKEKLDEEKLKKWLQTKLNDQNIRLINTK